EASRCSRCVASLAEGLGHENQIAAPAAGGGMGVQFRRCLSSERPLTAVKEFAEFLLARAAAQHHDRLRFSARPARRRAAILRRARKRSRRMLARASPVTSA